MTTRELHKSYISYIKLALFSDKKNYAAGKKISGTAVPRQVPTLKVIYFTALPPKNNKFKKVD